MRKKVKCNLCPKSFKKDYFKVHKNVCPGAASKACEECDQCGKLFNKGSLRWHKFQCHKSEINVNFLQLSLH